MLRLDNGDLGLAYRTDEDGQGADYTVQSWYFASSGNQGHNWSAGAPIDLPAIKELLAQLQHMWGNLIHLSTGRLIVPVYWCMKGGHPGMPPYGDDPVTGIIGGSRHTRVADGHMYEASWEAATCISPMIRAPPGVGRPDRSWSGRCPEKTTWVDLGAPSSR
jgi:hypothetical protein